MESGLPAILGCWHPLCQAYLFRTSRNSEKARAMEQTGQILPYASAAAHQVLVKEVTKSKARSE
jgi:hypothetical protein